MVFLGQNKGLTLNGKPGFLKNKEIGKIGKKNEPSLNLGTFLINSFP